MPKKGWITPIIVCLTFLLVLAFYKKPETTALTASTQIEPVLWNHHPSLITKLTFTSHHKSIEVHKKDEEWYLTQPIQAKANQLYIYEILSTFSNPHVLSIVDSNKENLKDYGIEETNKSITLYTASGSSYTLILGKAQSESKCYVYSPSTEKVYTLDKDSFANLTLDTEKWLNTDYLGFDGTSTAKISFSSKGYLHTLMPTLDDSKESANFKSETLSNQQINDLILFLKTTRVHSFVTHSASESLLEQYGLKTPLASITLHQSSGELTTLLLGKSIPNTPFCYATLKGSSNIFIIDCLTLN